jgi:hypothetical protein
MGAYKGRVNLQRRRNRFIKAKRIKASTATAKQSLRTPAPPNKTMTQGDELEVEKEDAGET